MSDDFQREPQSAVFQTEATASRSGFRAGRCALWWLAGLLVVGLPLAGKWARRNQPPRCTLDGLAIEAAYRARVVDRSGKSHSFCCIGCAARWLERQPDPPAAVYVTDEAGGGEVEAASATFVRSTVVTSPITRNHIHAFRHADDAEKHALDFDGWVLPAHERPFHGP
jgi:hypothetical protein